MNGLMVYIIISLLAESYLLYKESTERICNRLVFHKYFFVTNQSNFALNDFETFAFRQTAILILSNVLDCQFIYFGMYGTVRFVFFP